MWQERALKVVLVLVGLLFLAGVYPLVTSIRSGWQANNESADPMFISLYVTLGIFLLLAGARAVLFRVKYDSGGFGQWVHRLAQRAPSNKVVVAIANKLARIAWAVLSSGKDYRHQPLQQLATA